MMLHVIWVTSERRARGLDRLRMGLRKACRRERRRTQRRGGSMLAYERHGSGEPLVLLHGVTHRRQVWYPVLDRLAEQREVILVDLPGHGQSPPFVLNGLSVREALRRDFEGFLAELDLDRPHLA